MLTPSATIAVIGFGESGLALGRGLATRGTLVRAWDPQLELPGTHQAMRQRMEGAGVDVAGSLTDALRGAKLVICTLPAPQGMTSRVAPLLQSGQHFLDFGSLAAHEASEALGQLGLVIEDGCDVRQQARRGELP